MFCCSYTMKSCVCWAVLNENVSGQYLVTRVGMSSLYFVGQCYLCKKYVTQTNNKKTCRQAAITITIEKGTQWCYTTVKRTCQYRRKLLFESPCFPMSLPSSIIFQMGSQELRPPPAQHTPTQWWTSGRACGESRQPSPWWWVRRRNYRVARLK